MTATALWRLSTLSIGLAGYVLFGLTIAEWKAYHIASPTATMTCISLLSGMDRPIASVVDFRPTEHYVLTATETLPASHFQTPR